MTAQKKAEELVNKYSILGVGHPTSLFLPIQCAKIAVNEIIASVPTQPSSSETERIDAITFWVEVKQKLEQQ
jgi:hypothetical protein